MSERVEFFIEDRAMLDEPFHMKAIGLDNIYLLNGVSIEDDPDYGQLVTIENMDGLHRAIALHIIEKSCPLTGDEVRFLRKSMGLTQSELGRRLKVSSQSVALYEKGKGGIPGSVDTLLRISFAMSIFPDEAAVNYIEAIISAFETELRKSAMPTSRRNDFVCGWSEFAQAAC